MFMAEIKNRLTVVFSALLLSLLVVAFPVQADHGLTFSECESNITDPSDKALCGEHARVDNSVSACRNQDTALLRQQCKANVTPASDGYTGVSDGECTSGEVGCFGTTSGTDKIHERLNEIIAFLSVGAGVIITGSVIVAGIQFTFSGGNPQSKAKAIARMTNAGIAILLYVFGWALLNWLVPGGWLG